MQTTVSGFEVEYDGKVIGKNEDATTPESKRVVEEQGWGNHGIVITANDDVVFAQPDHDVNVDDVVNVVLDWGTDGSKNGGDADGSGSVDVDDIVWVVLHWGDC